MRDGERVKDEKKMLVVQFGKEASRTHDYWVAKKRPFVRLAQIAFDFAQARLSLRKERLLRMTITG